MSLPPLARFLLCGLLAVFSASPGLAQSAACERYRAELASLDAGGERDLDTARRQRIEIARLTGYYRSIGCGAAGFLGFGGPSPAECGPIARRIQALQANYDRLAGGEFADTNTSARRQQLLAVINQFCRTAREPGAAMRSPGGDPFKDEPGQEREAGPRDELFDRPATAGGRTLCVKTCDGSFFPLDSRGRAGEDEMCQALCPGTETRAYSAPHGPVSLEAAVSARGERYADLPTAFRFQKKRDPGCACKREGETWAQLLQQAETLLERRDGDVVVTAEKAEELSKPRPDKRSQAARERKREAQAAARGSRPDDPKPKPSSPTVPPGRGAQPAGLQKTPARAPSTLKDADALPSKERVRVVAPGLLSLPARGESNAP